jgi:hypothetical protein
VQRLQDNAPPLELRRREFLHALDPRRDRSSRSGGAERKHVSERARAQERSFERTELRNLDAVRISRKRTTISVVYMSRRSDGSGFGMFHEMRSDSKDLVDQFLIEEWPRTVPGLENLVKCFDARRVYGGELRTRGASSV